MPAVTFNLYDNFRKVAFNGGAVDFDTPTTVALKMAVLNGTFVPNQGTDTTFAGISANEVSGTGYTAGGNACNNGTVTLLAGVVTVDADDPATWVQDASGFANGRSAVLYEVSSGVLVGYSADFGADQGNLNGDFFVAFGAAGVLTSSRT